VSRATEVYAREFDSVFINLPRRIRASIEAKIQGLGVRLSEYPHQRLKGRSEFRLRVGDYRIIYEFDPKKNVVYLLAVGNRREIYR
jgi:mRNA interferase RelE/StbE